MRVSDLEKYGMPARIIDIWEKKQGASLLPVQSRAVRNGLLGERAFSSEYQPINMLISAPTSSGKSFCAEMAAIKALLSRKKSVMLFPLKSLAEQKYREICETYADLDLKIIIVSSDHPENDRLFYSSDFQIALAIYEKFDLLLTSSLDTLKNIGLVLVDEIQSLSVPGRGAILERILTKIQASVYKPSVIGLSAVITGNSHPSTPLRMAEKFVAAGLAHPGACDQPRHNSYVATGGSAALAEWLGAVIVEETARPIDLLRGIAAEGSYRYRSYNNHLDGTEPFVSIGPGEESFEAFIQQIKADGGSTLIFLKSRRETVDCAFRMAAAVAWPPASKAIEALNDEEPSFLIRSLKQAMSRGVAFHNSDLSPKQRQVVEQAFIDKEVKALFSTTTLSMGVNLPAETVYLETVKYAAGQYGSRPSLVPVSRAEFDNMSGRAGRLGMEGEGSVGRAIILAQSSFDREILWENYIAEHESLSVPSALGSMPPEDWALNMIVSGLADNRASLENLFGRTLYVATGGMIPREALDRAVDFLARHGFIVEHSADDRVEVTVVGRVAAISGLSMQQAAYFMKRLQADRPSSPAGWIGLALSSPSVEMLSSICSRFEYAQNKPLNMLHQLYPNLVDDIPWLLGDGISSHPLSYDQAALLKSFLLLHSWSELMPLQKIEERFQMHLGQILNLGETIAHLLGALGSLTTAWGGDRQQGRLLGEYAFSIRRGLPVKFREIYRHFGQLLTRSDFSCLAKEGLVSLDQFCQCDSEQLGSLFISKDKLLQINNKIETLKQEVDMQPANVDVRTQFDGGKRSLFVPDTIEIDGRLEGERFLVKVNGFPIRLTGKSFKYFTRLAYARMIGEGGWLYKEDIEIGFNQARYLYRMKNEVNAGLTQGWSVVENNRLGYYRLNCDPSRISIDFESLKEHPDFEVRQLAEGHAGEIVN